MKKIVVRVNGLSSDPTQGKMARVLAKEVIKSADMQLCSNCLIGPQEENGIITIDGFSVTGFKPEERNVILRGMMADIDVDFTTPLSVKLNVDFYTERELPFLLGTTGGNKNGCDERYIAKKVAESKINAVVAPNFSKEIVAFLESIKYWARTFPGSLKGYEIKIIESHPASKKDVSGTVMSMLPTFDKLGVSYSIEQVDRDKVRNEEGYRNLGIPEKYWNAHGWHFFSFRRKDDESVLLEYTTKVIGRETYAYGAMDAIRFLHEKNKNAFKSSDVGHVYSMINVMKGK